ncbi:hypothetical protein [Cellulosimicrobium protaetiae]|uniref:DUF4157 domain-containing protein n=1 Tax=Cellulosimicrobium protaetiae TaxID=2587808 RepID=A0A6M5UJ13_9MICO|nr:hypothetical protein [Cellulosimicrobium protaetiae]QJW37532.1 hypothetical protein FIC82_016440 [Cellulosimicrobium protaetiae]
MTPEPGLTPDEALRRAHAWAGAASSAAPGPERAHAEHAAAYWAAQHRALLAAVPAYGTAAVPVGAPSTTGYGTADATAAPAGYGSPAAQPGYGTPAVAPGYGAAVDGTPPAPWGAPPRRPVRRRAGRVGTVVLVVVVAVFSYLVNDRREARDDGAVLPTEQEGAVPPPTVWEDPSPDATTSASGTEAAWKAGDYAEPLPDPVPGSAQTSPFLPDHPDPTAWLLALNPANEGVQVVFTDDPELNCGMKHVAEHDAYATGSAGCFQPAHPTVLFVWWGEDADPATNQVLLAHELSHMLQWWHEFDLLQSAVDSGLAEDEEWQHALETDATCRVLSWGGYSEAAADRMSSPCDTDDWSPTWLAERATDLGVVLRDY